MKYSRQSPIISLEEFILLASKVKSFDSSTGKRYQVKSIENSTMRFVRLDADMQQEWSFKLENVYEAYIKIDDFKTISFKKFVPKKHSPARGLLLHLKLLK